MKKSQFLKIFASITMMTSVSALTVSSLNLNGDQLEAKAESVQKRTQVTNSFEAPYNTVVKVKGPDFSASGFVSGRSTVITNRHVLNSIVREGMGNTKIILAKNNANPGTQKDLGTFRVRGYKLAPNNIDLAILEIEPNENSQNIGEVVQPAKIKDANGIHQSWIENNPNNRFSVVGYPGDKDLNTMWIGEGSLLFFIGREDPLKFYGNMPGAPGSSGSPVFDENNEVVGIVYSGWQAGAGVNGLMFREELYDFVRSNI